MLPTKRVELVRMIELSGEEKLEMAREFFLSGNLSEIARKHRVYHVEMIELTRQVWFVEEVNSLSREAAAITRVKLTRLFDKSIEELEDRMTYGDTVVGMEGQTYRMPIRAKDLAAIAKIVFDTKKDLDSTISGSVLGTAESKRLRDLAAALRAVPVSGERLDKKIAEETIQDLNFISGRELEEDGGA